MVELVFQENTLAGGLYILKKKKICSYRSRFRFLRRKRQQSPFSHFDRLPFSLFRFVVRFDFAFLFYFRRFEHIYSTPPDSALRDGCATARNLCAHKNCASYS